MKSAISCVLVVIISSSMSGQAASSSDLNVLKKVANVVTIKTLNESHQSSVEEDAPSGFMVPELTRQETADEKLARINAVVRQKERVEREEERKRRAELQRNRFYRPRYEPEGEYSPSYIAPAQRKPEVSSSAPDAARSDTKTFPILGKWYPAHSIRDNDHSLMYLKSDNTGYRNAAGPGGLVSRFEGEWRTSSFTSIRTYFDWEIEDIGGGDGILKLTRTRIQGWREKGPPLQETGAGLPELRGFNISDGVIEGWRRAGTDAASSAMSNATTTTVPSASRPSNTPPTQEKFKKATIRTLNSESR